MIDISVPHRRTKGAQPRKTHRVLEVNGNDATETLCGIKVRFGKGDYLSAATMKRIMVATDGGVGMFNCTNCRCTWLRITSGD